VCGKLLGLTVKIHDREKMVKKIRIKSTTKKVTMNIRNHNNITGTADILKYL
jgi:hypothetical protein